MKRIIMVILALVIILAVSIGIIHYVQSEDMENIQSAAEAYIKDYEPEEKVIEFGPDKSSSFDDVYAITLKTDLGGKQMVKCVWFERDSIFKNRYVPQGISETEPGLVKAYRQRTGSYYFDYIFGMDIPEDKRHFNIPAILYKGKASEGEVLIIKDAGYVGPLEIEYSR